MAKQTAAPKPSDAPSSPPTTTAPASSPAPDTTATHTPPPAAAPGGDIDRTVSPRRVITAPAAPAQSPASPVKDERVGAAPKQPAEPKPDDRFKMLTNSAGFGKDQVVTRKQIEKAHVGVTLEDWIERKIVEPTEAAATPAPQ